MNLSAVLNLLLVLVLTPLLLGVVNRVKAIFAGRKGSPLFQLYYDIVKLLKKGAVYSRTTSWIFTIGPVISLSALLAATLLVPFAGKEAVFSFNGDIILFIYLLALGRFFTVLAALDTGSSFEGMGASREVQFAVFAEPALFLSVTALARITGQLSLSGVFAKLSIGSWSVYGSVLFLAAAALLIVFLAENSRMPIDDPNTHLELTMIHEVMVLDNSGVDFAYILYGAALKFWLLATLIVGTIFVTRFHLWIINYAVFILGMIIFAVIVGLFESILARLRLLKVPHILLVALSLSILALTFQMR